MIIFVRVSALLVACGLRKLSGTGLYMSIITISGVSVTETNWEGTSSQKPEA